MRRIIGSGLLVLLCACAQPYGGGVHPAPTAPIAPPIVPSTDVDPAPPPLSEAEKTAAADVAFRDLDSRGLRGTGPIYFVHAELLRDKAAPTARRALVQFYRYAGDLTITAVVDLGERRVVEVRSSEHVPTPLSREEAAQAREIAFSDPRVVQSLGGTNPQSIEVEPRLIFTTSREDPLYGHRAMELLFRIGRSYVSEGPIVIVDLTDRRVILEEPPRPSAHM